MKVWIDFAISRFASVYVPRCSRCGKYRDNLKSHWFFTGVYCVDCIQGVLYGGHRRVKEMNRDS